MLRDTLFPHPAGQAQVLVASLVARKPEQEPENTDDSGTRCPQRPASSSQPRGTGRLSQAGKRPREGKRPAPGLRDGKRWSQIQTMCQTPFPLNSTAPRGRMAGLGREIAGEGAAGPLPKRQDHRAAASGVHSLCLVSTQQTGAPQL